MTNKKLYQQFRENQLAKLLKCADSCSTETHYKIFCNWCDIVCTNLENKLNFIHYGSSYFQYMFYIEDFCNMCKGIAKQKVYSR